MIKIIMHGYLGRMGKVICELCQKDNDFEIVAGVDAFSATSAMPFPTYTNISDCDMPADVIIDFSTAAAVSKLLDYAVEKKVAVVVCTTGLSESTTEKINKTTEEIPVFKSANMSIGINLLASLSQKAAAILDDVNFDIEIIEKHHNQKIDAPSGTALLLADAINGSVGNKFEYIYDRSDRSQKRGTEEIGIHTVRGGTIVGEHSVIFAGKDETLEFTHVAQSKEVFAVGALKAAKFLKNKGPGFYNMEDMINEI